MRTMLWTFLPRFRERSRFWRIACIAGCLSIGLSSASAQPQAGKERHFALDIRGGKAAGAPPVIRVGRGDRVVLRCTTDTRAVVHLHGYEIEVPVGPEAPAELAFDAHATGRFPVTLHNANAAASHAHAVLLYLEVHPR